MRKLITFCKMFMFTLFLLGFALSSYGQDWTKQSSELYYIGSEGKVFIQPDYNAMAVYFKNDVISEETKQNFLQKFSVKESNSGDFDIMDLKGMIRIKSASSLKSINTLDDRQAFLSAYGLSKEDAYDVLPAFTIGDKQAWFTKRVMIRLNAGVTLGDISEVLAGYEAQFIKNFINDETYLLSVEKIENQLALIQELNNMGVLKWGEPDFKVDLVKSTNDPMYADQWHLNNTGGSIDGKALVADIDVNAPEAWGITTGVSNVVVAVIDDGVEAHEDMAPLLNGYTPVDGGNGAPSLTDDGHGQQVAGLIGAQHNSIGCAGIAPGTRMFSVNIFAPNTTNADVADGIVWSVDNGADILSNSWGFGSCTYDVAAITDAFAYAATNGRGGLGCISLVASGNDFQSCVSYPADLPTVTAVGGISGDGERSHYSNYGPALDISAPSDDDWQRFGRNWYSTGTHGLRTIDREGSAGWYSGNYSEAFGGTSGATPQVSAVAALVLSVNANLTKAEVENILYSTAKNVGDENEYGAGLVDAYAAVVAAGGGGGGDTEAPSVPTNLASSNITQNSFTLSWSASTDNIGVTGYDVYQNGGFIGSTANTFYNVTGLNPATTYTYTVKAKDAAGNESGASNPLDVTTLEESTNTPPVADAGGPYTGDEGTPIQFDGTGSSDADGDPLTYSWDFGDGNNGTGATPTHTYASAGSYTATLTVNDGTDSDQSTASVTVNSTGADQAMISAISLSTSQAGPWTKVNATVTITSGGQALADAFVEGYWSGDANSSASGNTAVDGTVVFNEKARNASSFGFTITNVTKAGYFWDVANSQTSATTGTTFFGGNTAFAGNTTLDGFSSDIVEFKLYPNPVNNGVFTIMNPEAGSDLMIYDLKGSVKLVKQLTSSKTEISVQDLSPGIYILKVVGQSDTKTQKIVIQ
jgi:subtilisin family serine protease